MAKFLIVLAAALLQANAGPLDFNPFTLPFKAPKMGLDIAQRVVGGVRDGLNEGGLTFVTGPLDMVQKGLNTPVSVISGLEGRVSSFEMPSFASFGGSNSDSQGLGGMMSNMFAMPQKLFGQATEMIQGQGQGLLSQGQGIMGGISGQVQNSVSKLQDSIAELQGKIPTEQLIEMIKQNAANAQEKTQGVVAGAKGQVEAIQKKVQEMQAQFAPKAEAMVGKIMENLQKQAQEAAAAGDSEVATKVQEQMKQVIAHANGLMTELQAVKKPEDAQKIADKFAADFSALYEQAKKQ